MLDFIIYELKVAAVLAAFTLCFKWLLSGEKMHRVNRVILVTTAVMSFILPLCVVTIHRTVTAAVSPAAEILQQTEAPLPVEVLAESHFPWQLVLVAVYWIGVLCVIAGMLFGIFRVVKVIREGTVRQIYGTEIIVSRSSVPPFSWMKWIVMSESDFESGNRHIIEHEKAHLRFGHSGEILLFDLMSAFQWFNPAIWLMKRDLRAIHEYEADDAVLRGGADIREYQYSLIRKAVSASGYSITNSFNHSILKNRITMMSKSKASGLGSLKVLYVLPLLLCALALNARTVYTYESVEESSAALASDVIKVQVRPENNKAVCFIDGTKVELSQLESKLRTAIAAGNEPVVKLYLDSNLPDSAVKSVDSQVKKISGINLECFVGDLSSVSVHYLQADEQPTFNGGDTNEFSKWVNSNLRYPAEAKSKGIQGRVNVQFVVDQFGQVSDVKINRGVEASLDAEAMRVISSSPAWTPGKVKGENVPVLINFPVTFQIGSPSASTPAKTPASSDQTVGFAVVDVKPTFNGGDANEFSSWVNSNLRYPEKAKNDNIQGRVTLTFTVKADGKVADVKVLRGIEASLDAEAVRVVSSSPAWTPGQKDGKKVDVTYTFPVIFQLRTGDKVSFSQAPASSEGPARFATVDVKPTFNGGDPSEFTSWIKANLRYPEKARSEKIQGMVTVTFTVKADGKVADVKVLRGIEASLDAEAVRVVSSSPAWTPGQQDGKNVDVTYTCPVIFQI